MTIPTAPKPKRLLPASDPVGTGAGREKVTGFKTLGTPEAPGAPPPRKAVPARRGIRPFSIAGTRSRNYSLAVVEAALRKNKGMTAATAQSLGCTSETLKRYFKKFPQLATLVEEQRILFLDTAELKLWRAVQAGEAWAICFCLKCLAKDRGYVERVQVAGPNGEPLPAPQQTNITILVEGDRATYLDRLKALRALTPGGNGQGSDPPALLAEVVPKGGGNGQG